MVAEEKGLVEFYESGSLVSPNDVSLVSTLNIKEVERWPKTSFERIVVETIPVNEIYPFERVPWDFITIDAEGYDLEILRQIDLTDVQLLCIEWNSIAETKKAILDYTSKFQMNKILYTSGENLLICRN